MDELDYTTLTTLLTWQVLGLAPFPEVVDCPLHGVSDTNEGRCVECLAEYNQARFMTERGLPWG